jgi:hypothetical protein
MAADPACDYPHQRFTLLTVRRRDLRYRVSILSVCDA